MKKNQLKTKEQKIFFIRQRTQQQRSKMTQALYDSVIYAAITLRANDICHTILKDTKTFLQQFNFLKIAAVGVGWVIELK